jgi:hypothetical protein
MADEEALTPDLTDDQKALLNLLPPVPQMVTNQKIRVALGWDEERYFPVRNLLKDAGLLITGRGRGGLVGRPSPSNDELEIIPVDPTAAPEAIVEQVKKTRQREDELYPPLIATLETAWALDKGLKPIKVKRTAYMGARQTFGRWSRPDISVLLVKEFNFLPPEIEVHTFEVKTFEYVDVQAVYEALAHRRFGTHSTVIFHTPPAEYSGPVFDGTSEIEEVARSHGIGIITAEDPLDYDSWTWVEEPIRVSPTSKKLDAFIVKNFPEESASLLAQLSAAYGQLGIPVPESKIT